jgi:sugar lactone lactonase YvrE
MIPGKKRAALFAKSSALAAVFLLFNSILVVPAQAKREYPWQHFWQESLAAYRNKDHAGFLENSRRAIETGPPNHPTLFYNLARAYSLTGNQAEAVRWLEKTLRLGFGDEALAGGDFLFLRAGDEFAGIRKRIDEIRAPKVKSRTAATVAEPDLIPESVAFDAAEKCFYVGSFYKRKIVRIDRRGRVTDFVAEAADGLGAVVGIKIDAARRVLLVLNNVSPEMKNFDKTREGVGNLHKYELKTGKLIKKYELPNEPQPHLLNDLAIAANGDLFITDTRASVVHVLRHDKENLENFASLAPYSRPNGIVLSKDESRLYVANLNGMLVVETKTAKQTSLALADPVALAGVDGLYLYENSLLAIQNFESPRRVVRFYLNETGDRAERAEVLETNHPLYDIPTTGALVGRDFYYIANSQLRSFDENGKLFPPEKLRNVTILKLMLPGPK